MPSLPATDLPTIVIDKTVYLYYQDEAMIREVYSSDGKRWHRGTDVNVPDLHPGGSSFTVFHVTHDGSLDNQSTIHVVYIDQNDTLREVARAVTAHSWDSVDIPEDIATAPASGSRVASGVCHDNTSHRSHHWVYFVQQNEGGDMEVVEIRKGSESGYRWVVRKVLDQKLALPGTRFGIGFTDEVTRLFFQDRDENIVRYDGSYSAWSNETKVLDKAIAMPSSPLATHDLHSQNASALAYVANPVDTSSQPKSQPKIRYLDENGKDTEVATWLSGSGISVADLNGTPHVFAKEANHPYAIYSLFYNGSHWRRSANNIAE